MKTKTLFGALGFPAVILAGCGVFAHPRSAPPTTCNSSGPCPVTVTVTGGGGSDCSIDVGDIVVKPGHKPDIEWKITNAGAAQYTFRAGAIEFNNKADPVPQNEFKDMGVQGAGSGYRVKDLHNTSGKRYNYKITVTSPGGQACSIDPIVANE